MTLIRHIPVFLNTGDRDPVGFGTIEGDKLTIVVENQLLINAVERLIHAENIKELYLGLGFPVAKGVSERTLL